jgi:hypothetical protein
MKLINNLYFMGAIMSQGASGSSEVGLTTAIMSQGATEQFKKEPVLEPLEVVIESVEPVVEPVLEPKELIEDAAPEDNVDQILNELRAKYEEKEGKPVPVNKKNDIEWMTLKINS